MFLLLIYVNVSQGQKVASFQDNFRVIKKLVQDYTKKNNRGNNNLELKFSETLKFELFKVELLNAKFKYFKHFLFDLFHNQTSAKDHKNNIIRMYLYFYIKLFYYFFAILYNLYIFQKQQKNFFTLFCYLLLHKYLTVHNIVKTFCRFPSKKLRGDLRFSTNTQ